MAMKKKPDPVDNWIVGNRDKDIELGSKEVENQTSEEVKNNASEEVKKFGSKEEKIKRSYMLKKSTVKLLDRMKLDYYDVGITLEEIVDEAIVKLYESKRE